MCQVARMFGNGFFFSKIVEEFFPFQTQGEVDDIINYWLFEGDWCLFIMFVFFVFFWFFLYLLLLYVLKKAEMVCCTGETLHGVFCLSNSVIKKYTHHQSFKKNLAVFSIEKSIWNNLQVYSCDLAKVKHFLFLRYDGVTSARGTEWQHYEKAWLLMKFLFHGTSKSDSLNSKDVL